MTIPEERTRALKWAGEFLVEVLRTPECPQELREQARMILRHYPDAASIERRAHSFATEVVGPWLAPEW